MWITLMRTAVLSFPQLSSLRQDRISTSKFLAAGSCKGCAFLRL